MKIKIELHAHDSAPGWVGHMERGQVRDITAYVTSLVAELSTNAPWETMALGLTMPWEQVPYVLPGLPLSKIWGAAPEHARIPCTGFWVVVRMEDAGRPEGDPWPALWWGRVQAVSGSLTVGRDNGALKFAGRLGVTSWWSMIDASDLLFAIARQARTLPGLIENLKGWGDTFEGLLRQVTSEPPGVLFDHLWKQLLRVELPESLSGGRLTPLHDLAILVHDRASCSAWAPLRMGQMQRVPGVAIEEFGVRLFGGKLGRFMRNSFEADPSLVEVFPSLEFPLWGRDAPPFKAEDEDNVERSGRSDGSGRRTALGKILGAQPVMIYRMRPTLTTATGGENSWARIAARKLGRQTTYGQEPVDVVDQWRSGWFTVTAQEWSQFEFAVNDAHRVNATYIAPSSPPTGEQNNTYGLWADPVEVHEDIRRNGARALRPRWPFWGRGKKAPDANFWRDFSATSEVVYQMTANNGVHGEHATCKVTIPGGRPWVRQGHWWEVGLGHGALNTAVGYGSQVRHSLSLERGSVEKMTTTVTLERTTLGTNWATLKPLAERDELREKPT